MSAIKIISSQRYLHSDTVADKIAELLASGASSVTIRCADIGEIDGQAYAMVVDGHHLAAAARELGLTVEYAIGADAEGLRGEAALEARWVDSRWYDHETGQDVW